MRCSQFRPSDLSLEQPRMRRAQNFGIVAWVAWMRDNLGIEWAQIGHD